MRAIRDIVTNLSIEEVSIQPNVSVLEAIKRLEKVDVGALLVMNGAMLEGVFSERDYTRKVVLNNRTSENTTVKAVMTNQVMTISMDESLVDCLACMSENKIRHLPVVDELGRVHGLVSILDVANALLVERQAKIQHLEKYVSETWPF